MSNVVIGKCPICDRDMWQGPSIDRHHFYPKCKGGRETEYLHKICHRKIHSLYKETELAKKYNTAESLKDVAEIIEFVKWISNKEPDFYDRNVTCNRKRRR
jgi:hypothetical protein